MDLFLADYGHLNKKKAEEMDGNSLNSFERCLKIFYRNVKVLDNAPYHTRKLEKIPMTATRQNDIQD